MKKTLLVLPFIMLTFCVFAQNNSIEQLNKLSFYTDYEWNEKSALNPDSSIYRNTLVKRKEMSGIVLVNRSWDSSKKEGKLQPFLTGVAGWDPVEEKIVFLDFSRDGMMVEGTIQLADSNTVQYDFDFAFPGNKRKLTGRDVLKFNDDKTEFIWLTYIKTRNGEYRLMSETAMVRGELIPLSS